MKLLIVIKPEILGTRRVEYTNKDGKLISGSELHFQWEDDHVIGLACANAYFSDFELQGNSFKVGDSITLAYDPYNKAKRFSFLAL